MAFPGAADEALEQILRAATEHHMAGRLEQAGAGYGQVLALHPDHGVTLHRFGILCLQSGRFETARELLARPWMPPPGGRCAAWARPWRPWAGTRRPPTGSPGPSP